MVKEKAIFKKGDIVTDGIFKMIVLAVIYDEKGIFYECKPVNFKPLFTREIPQKNLKKN